MDTIKHTSRHVDAILAICPVADNVYTLEPDGHWSVQCKNCTFAAVSTDFHQYPFLTVEKLGKLHETDPIRDARWHV